MKLVILLFCVIAAVAAIDVYPTKYDEIDIDAILSNKRLVENYVKCLLKEGKCNEEGEILRDIIPDALITACKKCNAKQKSVTDKVIKFLIKERPADWEKLLRLYDPDGKYKAEYSHWLKN